jgi:hypothetical protein
MPAVLSLPGCAFCGAQSPLCESHIIPRWAYKRARAKRTAAPDPLLVADGSIIQTSRQLFEKLLCGACEHEFGLYDEFVADLAYTSDGAAPILSMVKHDSVFHEQDVEIAHLDLNKLKGFALSVVWRAHACRSLPKVTLGKYATDVAEYLRGSASFPRSVRLRVLFFVDWQHSLRPRHLLERLIVLPQSNRMERATMHWFMVGGFRFEVAVGSGHHQSHNQFCIHHGSRPLLLIRDPYLSGMIKNITSTMRGARPRGAWEKRSKGGG